MHKLTVQPLHKNKIGNWAAAWPSPLPEGQSPNAWKSQHSDFWHVHDFDPGEGGETEVLWVTYRPRALVVSSLEVHWHTQQAVVPLGTASIIQVICPSKSDGSTAPDLEHIGAWLIQPGQGICMMPGCWHTTFALNQVATTLMLSRRSTTLDLVDQLNTRTPLPADKMPNPVRGETSHVFHPDIPELELIFS